MSKKMKWYKFRDKNLFKSEIQRFGKIGTFAMACGVHKNTITRYMNENAPIDEQNATSVSNTLKLDFDKLFVEVQVKYDRKEQEKNQLSVSEEIICGLRRNVEDRLNIIHEKIYVNSIMKIIDEIIIESSYMGVNCKEQGNEQFIVKAIQKRRNIK